VSLANPGDTGDLVADAVAHGAVLADMDQAWWVPVSLKGTSNNAGFGLTGAAQRCDGLRGSRLYRLRDLFGCHPFVDPAATAVRSSTTRRRML
jgi:hypothetical protein